MKKKLMFLIAFLSSFNLQARSLLDGYLPSNSNYDSRVKQSEVSKFIDKNISGAIGSSYVSSDSGERKNSFAKLRFDNDNKYSRIVLAGQFVDSEIELNQKNSLSAEERTVAYSYDDPEILESYIDLKLMKNLTLSAGIKKVVWGQFEPFSPIDFSLPIYFSRNFVEYTKQEGRVPKETYSLTYFPHPKIELSGYFFPEYEVDPIIERINQDDEVTMPIGSGLHQSAGRLMFYPEFATFGFTYFNGFSHMDNSKGYIYDSSTSSYQKNPFLIENEMIGFEFSKKLGKYGLKFEYSISDTVTDLVNNIVGNSDYQSWVTNQNNNKLYVDGDLHFGAAGIDFASGLWNYDFMVYYYEIKYDEAAQQGVDYDEIINNDDEDGPTGIGSFLPSFNISRYITDAKNTKAGLAVGVLGVGQGAATYVTGTINESFKWMVAAEYLEYFANMMIDEAYDDGNFEAEDDMMFGLRASIQYNF